MYCLLTEEYLCAYLITMETAELDIFMALNLKYKIKMKFAKLDMP